ncbi:methyltransferase [Aureimonas sp. SA4125]|uniref:tRNA1(Val) (adenine(37)-N6)-methyltransferase n=1 Tax=Aureimonas sp. SA4125 TaxID=2826993 RepID=UPI001CC5125E|nr:methyltransferase [Aureimonas sp. SA4125]BDA83058.1 methyltransferase [Aureimonas sp. SA4125]
MDETDPSTGDPGHAPAVALGGEPGTPGAPDAMIEPWMTETSIDSFQGGRFHLAQPKGRGFRAGLDALLLAASLPAHRSGTALDLGSGAGAVAFAVAARCEVLHVTLVENDKVMAGFARHSLALAENAALAPRIGVVEANVLGRRAEREAAGLADGAFQTVMTNPPFHPAGGRASPDPLRHAARATTDADFLGRWIRSGAALLGKGGLFAMIARPDSLEEILVATDRRLGDIRILPVHSHAGMPAMRILVHARKGSRAPLSLLPGIVLHHSGGGLTDLGQGIGTGEATLDLGLR